MATRIKTKTKSSQGSGPLNRYQSMRDFHLTGEPRGSARKSKSDTREALPFVVQKHAATRLHYDFRLGWEGVLKSWAVTKGPSYNPADKRLAVQVEDHPWDYRDFEGIIPKGQYGGGTVMVWDQGVWLPHGDVDQGLRDGHLKFELHGKKLVGDWVLVRMHARPGSRERADKPNWLLIKEKDEFVRDESSIAITDEAPDSAVSDRTMEEIASNRDRVWNSREPSQKGTSKSMQETPNADKKRQKKKSGRPIAGLQKLPTERFPGFVSPQLAQSASKSPSSDEWLHELKLDGYRIQILVPPEESKAKRKRLVQLLTRKGLDWSARMSNIAAAAEQLPVASAILDGEAVVLDDRGVTDFAKLQAAFQEGSSSDLVYFAFDVLHLDGHNLRGLPLTQRREILEHLLQGVEGTSLRLSDAIGGKGTVIFEKACALGAEGIVSKLASSKYVSGRSGAWLKLKCYLEQEFVIGGFTLPSNGIVGVGSLLLGYYDSGKLQYAGRTGTGFTQAIHRALRLKLDLLTAKASPFVEVPRDMQKGVHWVKPQLVAQVSFTTWTRDNLVRQAAFKGLREDKSAKEVTREYSSRPKSSDAPSNKPTASKQHQDIPRSASKLTHPEKILDAESGLTKRALAEYLEAVADHMLPHIADRPLSVVRCPDGNGKPCFFQKHIGVGTAQGVNRVSIRNRKSGKKEEFLTVDSVNGLLGLAQMGVLEIHTWGSRNEDVDLPDRIVLDLDPDSVIDWRTLANTALELKKRLSSVGLKSFVKSTGGKGLHVVAPIRAEYEWRVIKEFSHELVIQLEREQPKLYVTKMSLAARKNRIFLDYLRNDREATAIAPYSPRARSGAPVSMPLDWDELKLLEMPKFHIGDYEIWRKRLRRDPWIKLSDVKQALTVAEK